MHLCQANASFESSCFNALHGVGDDNGSQAFATSESIASEACHSAGDGRVFTSGNQCIAIRFNDGVAIVSSSSVRSRTLVSGLTLALSKILFELTLPIP